MAIPAVGGTTVAAVTTKTRVVITRARTRVATIAKVVTTSAIGVMKSSMKIGADVEIVNNTAKRTMIMVMATAEAAGITKIRVTAVQVAKTVIVSRIVTAITTKTTGTVTIRNRTITTGI